MTKARDLASGGFGLVLVKPSSVVNGTDNGKGTVNFSAQTSVSLNGVFNSTYQNYRILINIASSSGDTNAITLKFRAGGSDTSANYRTVRIFTSGTTVSASNNDRGTDEFFIFESDKDQNGFSGASIELQSPNEARATSLQCVQTESDGTFYMQILGGYQSDNTQFDGFTIINSAGNTTGTISVYGYNK